MNYNFRKGYGPLQRGTFKRAGNVINEIISSPASGAEPIARSWLGGAYDIVEVSTPNLQVNHNIMQILNNISHNTYTFRSVFLKKS